MVCQGGVKQWRKCSYMLLSVRFVNAVDVISLLSKLFSTKKKSENLHVAILIQN